MTPTDGLGLQHRVPQASWGFVNAPPSCRHERGVLTQGSWEAFARFLALKWWYWAPFHFKSPISTNVIILLKAQGCSKEIFSFGFELTLVCIRNGLKVLPEAKGFPSSKRELHNPRSYLFPCYLPHPLPLAFAKHMFSSLSQGEKSHFSLSCTSQRVSALHLP